MLITVAVTIASILIIVLIIHSFWRYGHKESWGGLAEKFKTVGKERIKSKAEVIYINNSKGWEQWCCCRIRIDNSGIYLQQPMVLGYLIPSVKIPLTTIRIESPIRPWFFRYIALSIHGISTKVALPYKYLSELNKYKLLLKRSD